MLFKFLFYENYRFLSHAYNGWIAWSISNFSVVKHDQSISHHSHVFSRENRDYTGTPSRGLLFTIYTKLTLCLDVYERFHADFRQVSEKISIHAFMMLTKLSNAFFVHIISRL